METSDFERLALCSKVLYDRCVLEQRRTIEALKEREVYLLFKHHVKMRHVFEFQVKHTCPDDGIHLEVFVITGERRSYPKFEVPGQNADEIVIYGIFTLFVDDECEGGARFERIQAR